MKTLLKRVVGLFALFGLVLAMTTVHAQPGPSGASGAGGANQAYGPYGPNGMDGFGPGMMGRGVMVHRAMKDQQADMKIVRELFTPTERLEMMDHMMDAKTVEERQTVMLKNQVELEKRAKEKGVALPIGHHSPLMFRQHCG